MTYTNCSEKRKAQLHSVNLDSNKKICMDTGPLQRAFRALPPEN